MKVVADTNIYFAVVLDAPEKKDIIKLTHGYDLAAPEILPFEIGNALTAMMKKRKLEAGILTKIWDIIQTIPVELCRTNIRTALEIASRFNIYAYDAYFIECAEALRCPLLTLDKRLKNVANDSGILILE